MNMINGYLIRLRLDINGYVWIQQITIWICQTLSVVSTWIYFMDINVYLRWISHLNIHGYAKWKMDMNGYLDG